MEKDTDSASWVLSIYQVLVHACSGHMTEIWLKVLFFPTDDTEVKTDVAARNRILPHVRIPGICKWICAAWAGTAFLYVTW